MKQKIANFIKNNLLLLLVITFSLVYFVVTLKLNIFRYNNFDYGKFDLGNMTQMVWNASRGNGLWLTDYFGTNLPRWAMSHVDPILYILVPFFIIVPHALTLVVFQLIMVIFSTVLVFLIAQLILKNKVAAFFITLAYLFNPSIGYLTAYTGFHGVTAVIPYFFMAFYIFEKMYTKKSYKLKNVVLLWVFLILTMMGKEQIPTYTFLFGFYILILRNDEAKKFSDLFKTFNGKLALSIMVVSLLWFIMAFFVIIPRNAHYRIEGYAKFADSLGISSNEVRNVALPNYFLNRYDEFGSSYSEIMKNILLNPQQVVRVVFGGDKTENFVRTFAPFAFIPFVAPFLLLMAGPDLAINFLTTAGGIGTSEIMNHRISMIIPVLVVSTIFGILYVSNFLKKKLKTNITSTFLALIVFCCALVTSHKYNNPIYLWTLNAVTKRVVPLVQAKTAEKNTFENLEIGKVINLSPLEDKDRECALKIVKSIPNGVSVSGPDSLGTHLAQRETYAIFPALYNEADYVIADVFSRKILTILDVDLTLVHDVISDIIKSENYKLKSGCGNYFVFENIGSHTKNKLLPIQEKFNFNEKMDYPFFQGLFIVDYAFPEVFTRGENADMRIVYKKQDSKDKRGEKLDDYILFTSFVHKDTFEIHQFANLPSYALLRPDSWTNERYYIEDIEVALPNFVDSGEYYLFVGMDNKIRTRSIYLGSVFVK